MKKERERKKEGKKLKRKREKEEERGGRRKENKVGRRGRGNNTRKKIEKKKGMKERKEEKWKKKRSERRWKDIEGTSNEREEEGHREGRREMKMTRSRLSTTRARRLSDVCCDMRRQTAARGRRADTLSGCWQPVASRRPQLHTATLQLRQLIGAARVVCTGREAESGPH
jgi:hypothetical protein